MKRDGLNVPACPVTLARMVGISSSQRPERLTHHRPDLRRGLVVNVACVPIAIFRFAPVLGPILRHHPVEGIRLHEVPMMNTDQISAKTMPVERAWRRID